MDKPGGGGGGQVAPVKTKYDLMMKSEVGSGTEAAIRK